MEIYEIVITEEARGPNFVVVAGEITSANASKAEINVSASSEQCGEIWVIQQQRVSSDRHNSCLELGAGFFTIIFFDVKDFDCLFEFKIAVNEIESELLVVQASTLFEPKGSFSVREGSVVEGWILDPSFYSGRGRAFLSFRDARTELTFAERNEKAEQNSAIAPYSSNFADGIFRFKIAIPSLTDAFESIGPSDAAIVLTCSDYLLHCEVVGLGGSTGNESNQVVDRQRQTFNIHNGLQSEAKDLKAMAPTTPQELISSEILQSLQDPLIFDSSFYSKTYQVTGSESEIVIDYLSNLHRAGSPYFDPDWYMKHTESLDSANIHPLKHYLSVGRKEKLPPSPIFNGERITMSRLQIEDVIARSNLFDSDWYLHKYPDVARSNADPIKHYAAVGHLEYRRWPNALFDSTWYIKQAKEIAELGWNPLVHYLLIGGYKELPTHPLFDVKWFLSATRHEADLQTPLHKALDCMKLEVAGPNEYFDTRFYADRNPESRTYPGGIVSHYTEVGWKKSCDPSEHFSTSGYLAVNPDVRASNSDPLQHFILNGRIEGRNPKPQMTALPASLDRFGAKEYGASGPSIAYDKPVELPEGFSQSIAVHLHLYYGDMIEEFTHYLNNIPARFDLYVSVPQGRGNADDIRSYLEANIANCSMVKASVTVNRGRDLAPFLVEFGHSILSYDLVLHMHTKRSPHSPKHADWRRYLLHYVLGNASTVSQILTIFHNNEEVGIVQPPYHAQIQAQPKWGDNRERVTTLLARLGLIFAAERCPDFPAGSFFWARTDAIRPLLAGRLRLEDFDEEDGQIDGTTAHAIERVLGIVPILRGYTTVSRYIDVAHNLINYYGKSRSYLGFDRDRSAEIVAYQNAVRARAGKRAQTAVVTAIMGPFDALLLPEHLEPDVDYFCVSDTVVDGYGVFRVIKPTYVDSDPRRTARYVKTNILRLFRGYQFAVWVDGNVLVRDPISTFVKATVASGACIGAIPHPIRASYIEEAEVAIEMKLDEQELIKQQISFYASDEDVEGPQLIETNFMVFDRRKKQSHTFTRLWWNQINTFSRRDQLSINYCLRQARAEWYPLLDEYKSTRDSKSFCLFRHGLNVWGRQPHIYSNWYRPFMFDGCLPPLQDHHRWKKEAGTLHLDVVVCVHNALDDVRVCLASLDTALEGRGRIIVVDDASEFDTAEYLRTYAAGRSDVDLIRHEVRLAYTKAANSGVKFGQNKYVLLLNSDTVTPPGSLDKLVDALDRDDLLGIVGPLSNAASYQSVPSTTGTSSQTAINSLPNGMSVGDMDRYLSRWWSGGVVRTPLVHGFCFCVRRLVFDSVGLFDEINFPSGYGEENDFCFRTMDAGFDIGVHPGTYVFHAKSKSYSEGERTNLMSSGMAALVRKFTKSRIVRAVETMQNEPTLIAARAAVLPLFADGGTTTCAVRDRRRLFLLPARRSDGLPAGSGYVRLLLPYGVRSLESDWEVIELRSPEVPGLRSEDCVIVQRDGSAIDTAKVDEWLTTVRSSGARLIYEVDDDLLDAEGLVRRGFGGSTAELALRVHAFAQHADCVTVSSLRLKEMFSAINPNVVLLPNTICADLWGLRSSQKRRFAFELPRNDLRAVRIGYVGTPTHGHDLSIIRASIAEVLGRYPGRVSFQVIGGFGSADESFGEVIPLPYSNDYPAFVRWLQTAAMWDIGLIPLGDDNFNASKSYLKYVEYAALGSAVVCSDVYEYSRAVQQNVTGLKVDNTTAAWTDAICGLISDADRRESLALAALSDVRENHTNDAILALLKKVLVP